MKNFEEYLDMAKKQLNGVKDGVENSRMYAGLSKMVDDLKADRDYECAKRVFESLAMPTDIIDEPDKKLYIIDIPGYKKENIDVHIEDGMLCVSAAADSSCEEACYELNERDVMDRSRSYVIDEEVEDVKASYKDGVLTIEMRKKKPKVTKISIN